MNKTTPEYIRVREEIGKYFCELLGFKWEWIGETDKERHREQADSILEIKGVAILADEQELPHFFIAPSGRGGFSAYELDKPTTDEMLKSNFKKVVE